MRKSVMNFIEKNWDRCISESRTDREDMIGVPYPYSTPNSGCFDAVYYWDTYFTNVGLMLAGRQLQAKNNVDAILYLVNKLGFMPNSNKRCHVETNSQPPFLSEMVREIYEYFKDEVWLSSAFNVLKKEYEFFMTQRITPIGLNAYGSNAMSMQRSRDVAEMYKRRTGYDYSENEIEKIAYHAIAICESGWDMSPRWLDGAQNYASVDLNSLMYGFEKNMAYFARELGEDAKIWDDRAAERKQLMIKYMTAEDGLLMDYNFVTGKHSSVFSVASIYPLYMKVMDQSYAEIVLDNIDRLTGDFGVYACEKNNYSGAYQWNYPNGWPPHQLIAMKAFNNYGYTELAKEIARKYIDVVERSFKKTENLWEKYNVENGTNDTEQEISARGKLPDMMGWTAGVYLSAVDFLENR
ncbi:MAG: alpha,alpha-trehalase [Clostridia bacterium]|nr:alpha,alpha-trehalase [Clostridia bacterium]